MIAQANELKISRLYDAPVQAVWDAWTDPAQVAKWWGPRGFTITTHSKDLRPGGHWAYTMHGPDGTDYENKTIYHEVEERARLVYDHGGNDDRPPLFRVTVLFREVAGRTEMDMTMTLPTPEAAQEARKFIKAAGGNSTWDRLAEYLAQEESGAERFVINRTFEAPRDVVFALWTDPAHLVQWVPPLGFTLEFQSADIRTGGHSRYTMSNGPMVIHGRSDYREVHAPDRIVYTQQFCDEHGAPSRHPMAPTFPETLLNVVEFASEGPNATRVTITTESYGPVTKEEIAFFAQSRSGMTGGWTGSFDKLEDLLAAR